MGRRNNQKILMKKLILAFGLILSVPCMAGGYSIPDWVGAEPVVKEKKAPRKSVRRTFSGYYVNFEGHDHNGYFYRCDKYRYPRLSQRPFCLNLNK